MKKLLTSLLLCASLFFIAACDMDDDTNDTNGTTNGTQSTTSAPLTNNDQKSPIKLSNYRLVSEFIDERLFVSVDVEIDYDDLLPIYEVSLKDPDGQAIVELTKNDENPALQSCDLAIQNANLQSNNTLKCNSMFEVKAEGTYTLEIVELDNILHNVTLEVKNNKVTIVE
ncbi:MAG: hypothetical protein K0Q49_1930 [Haloplasmataceae bacterium]|jgi:LAS superfamily LD-carboxypeptidase LdcB|nr:hypothetical protein [Haloplasmataceae bacterium]